MSNTKSTHRRRSAPPVRRASWGKRQIGPNAPPEGTVSPYAGLPTLEEFKAFFSSIRGKSTPVVLEEARSLHPSEKHIALTFSLAEGGVRAMIVMDLTAAVVIGGGIRRRSTADIRHCLETRTVPEEVMKALRYMGRRMADMVSSTDGIRLYFQDVTEASTRLPKGLSEYFEQAPLRMGFQLDLGPFGTGHMRLVLDDQAE